MRKRTAEAVVDAFGLVRAYSPAGGDTPSTWLDLMLGIVGEYDDPAVLVEAFVLICDVVIDYAAEREDRGREELLNDMYATLLQAIQRTEPGEA